MHEQPGLCGEAEICGKLSSPQIEGVVFSSDLSKLKPDIYEDIELRILLLKLIEPAPSFQDPLEQIFVLSVRQRVVAACFAYGYSGDQIADLLDVTTITVRRDLVAIRKRFPDFARVPESARPSRSKPRYELPALQRVDPYQCTPHSGESTISLPSSLGNKHEESLAGGTNWEDDIKPIDRIIKNSDRAFRRWTQLGSNHLGRAEEQLFATSMKRKRTREADDDYGEFDPRAESDGPGSRRSIDTLLECFYRLDSTAAVKYISSSEWERLTKVDPIWAQQSRATADRGRRSEPRGFRRIHEIRADCASLGCQSCKMWSIRCWSLPGFMQPYTNFTADQSQVPSTDWVERIKHPPRKIPAEALPSPQDFKTVRNSPLAPDRRQFWSCWLGL